MKRNKSFMVFLLIAVLMLVACSNLQMADDKNNINISEEESGEDDIQEKDNEPSSETDLDEEYIVDGNVEEINRVFYGKVKSIIGNEIEIEIGTVPDQTWDEKIDPEEKKKPGVSEIMVKEKENPPGMEDIIAPNPPEYGGSIFGKDGEINLTYTGESRTLIIPAGTDIRNTLDKKETLDSIKKGTVLMVIPKVIEGKDAGIEVLRILS